MIALAIVVREPAERHHARHRPRVVAANEHWTAFVPAAARWPYEVQLFPARKVPDLPALTGAERNAFVDVGFCSSSWLPC